MNVPSSAINRKVRKVILTNFQSHKLTTFYLEDGLNIISGSNDNGKTASQIAREGGSLTDVHWNWGGNITESGYINKSGQKFKEIILLKKGIRQAITLQNKKVLLDKRGQIIKKY
jgi:hypothetical protein